MDYGLVLLIRYSMNKLCWQWYWIGSVPSQLLMHNLAANFPKRSESASFSNNTTAPTHRWWGLCCCPKLRCPCLRGTSWRWGWRAVARLPQGQYTGHWERWCHAFCRATAESPAEHHPVVCWWCQTHSCWRSSGSLNKQRKWCRLKVKLED